MKVLVTEPLAEEGIARLRAEPGIDVHVRLKPSPEELLGLIPEYSGLIVRSSTSVDKDLLAAAEALKIVGRAGSGVDNIDLQAATGRGVVVVNTPGGNAVSVAELVMGLTIACARKIAAADRKLKAGTWAKKESKGRELNGKTMGIIGLGRIGREVARRARSFGLQVLGYDPFVAEGDFDEQGVRLVGLEELLAACHFVTMHVPRTDRTMNMIAADELGMMMDGAVLINAARGGLVDEAALLDALNGGKIAAAGLDVFSSEPEPLADLVRHENVVATPHIGASTAEAQEQVGYYVAGYVADYLIRGVVQSSVNYPAISAEEMRSLGPHLPVAERLGAFSAQVASGRMREMTATYFGELVSERYALLTDRALCGALRPFLDDTAVNTINARSLAEQRGLKIIEATSSRERGFAGMIRVELLTDEESIVVEGAAVGEGRPPRLVAVDTMKIDAPLEGPTLFFKNDDVPGVIGKIGTYAGENGINIANFALRSDQRGGAIGVVQIDKRISNRQRKEIKSLPGVRFVRMVDLP